MDQCHNGKDSIIRYTTDLVLLSTRYSVSWDESPFLISPNPEFRVDLILRDDLALENMA